MNVPKNVTDQMLLDYLSELGFGVHRECTFRCGGCDRLRDGWMIIVAPKAKRGDVVAAIGGTFGVVTRAENQQRRKMNKAPRPIQPHKRWCLSCCRTIRDIALSDIVAMRLLLADYQIDPNEIPF